MTDEPPTPIERGLRWPGTWFVLAVIATFVQSLFPTAIGRSWILAGIFAVPFAAGLFARWRGVVAIVIGNLLTLLFLGGDRSFLVPAGLTIATESIAALYFSSKSRFRFEHSRDVYLFAGLALATSACRCMAAMVYAMAIGDNVPSAGLATATAGLFSIFVTAPALIAWSHEREDSSIAWGRWLETAVVLLTVIVTTFVVFKIGVSIVQPLPNPALALLILPVFWIAIRYELIGAATFTFLTIMELIGLSAFFNDFRTLADPTISEFHHQIALLLTTVLLGCTYLISAIARSHRIQSRESLVLVAALRQKAEKMIALNQKLTIQTNRSRDQAERLLVQNAELEDANQRLAAQEAWLDAVLSSMPVGVYIIDKNERVLDRSHAFTLTKGLDDVLPTRDVPDINRELQVRYMNDRPYQYDDWPIVRAVRTGERVTGELLKIRQSDGDWQIVSINAAPMRNKSGEITGAVASSINVTDRENLALRVGENDRRVRYALQSAKAIVWERQVNGGMGYRTSSMSEWLDYPLETGFDRLDVYFAHVHPDDRERGIQSFRDLSSRVGEFNVEYRMVKKNGDIIWVLTRGETLPDANGQPATILGAHFDITTQKETEIKLRFLESAIIHTRDAVVLIDAAIQPNAGRSVLYVNDAFCRMSGYDRDEVVGRSLNVLRGPDSDPGTLDSIRSALDLGQSFQTEILNYRKNNSAYWAELTLEPVRDEAGTTLHWVMIQRDITDRRRAADALRRSEEMFRGIFENAWAGVSLTDPKGRFVSANPAFTVMLGLTEGELIGRHARDVTTPESWEKQQPIARNFIEGKIDRYQFKKEYRKADGGRFWGELFCNAIRGPSGEFLYGLGVTVDVTERTRLENQLRESEARLRAVYENSAAGVIVVDPDSVIVEVNPAFARMLGYTAPELIGRAVSEITHPEDISHERLRLKELIEGKIDNAQVRKRYIHKNGDAVIADLYTRCIRGDSGVIKFRIGVTIDMTERITLEDQLRHAQKMEAVGQMAGGIAHDFNNLLTAIIGNLSLVRRANPQEMLQLVSSAEQAAGRAADLTRKLLGFARRSQLHLAPINPQHVISEVVDILKRTLNPLIVIQADLTDCSTVLADPTLLNQVLVNLCLNSRDAMPHGGRLTLAAVNVTHDAPPTGILPGRFVNLSVTDTGEGMTVETKSRIFEPFFTTKSVGKGTGLGLSMVMGTIQQHGGWVDCSSDPGVGTRFDIYLPVSDLIPIEPPPSLADETPIEIEFATRRDGQELVLLVDDEPLVRTLARAVLESDGYLVVESEDGVEAVEWVRQHPSRASLIVMDVTMPRMSGRDAYELITAIDPTANVIFSSGYSAEDISDVVSSVGMLAKPYRPTDLLRTVRAAIDRQPIPA